MANEVPAWGYELEYYINIAATSEPEWVKATELLTWEQSGESKAYEPAWLDRRNPPKFTYARTCSINFEKDTMRGGKLEAWVAENRNALDVPCEIVAVCTWLGTASAMTADKATFLFSPNAFKNSNQGQPVVTSGTFNMADDDWTEGTWNPATPAFTAGGETPANG